MADVTAISATIVFDSQTGKFRATSDDPFNTGQGDTIDEAIRDLVFSLTLDMPEQNYQISIRSATV